MVKCANIFAKINITQKAVNPSIAFQLFGYAEGRSPQKTAHEIAEQLNNTQGSPFFKKLRMLGTKDDWAEGGVLSQSTFCKELMKLYSKNPSQDEYNLLRKKELENYEGYPLRDFFREKKDQRILDVIWNFFYNIALTWKDQWKEENSILIKTTGYAAFIQVLRNWLLSDRKDQILENKGVIETLNRIKDNYISDNDKFIRQNYPSGNQGVIKLRDKLLTDLELKE